MTPDQVSLLMRILVQIRLAEYFQVFNLDLQVRAHYAPNDSRSHIAEQVMRSLNEATGDGRSILLPKVPLFDGMYENQICALSQDEFNALERQRQEDMAKQCAEDVVKRYQGKRCLGTTIHALTPSYKIPDNFFFDDDFMRKIHNSSPSMQRSCAGSGYYAIQLKFVKQHYIVYDGAIEGIRNGCYDGEKMCTIHQEVLGSEWRGLPVHRVPTPVPSSSRDKDGFHYTMPEITAHVESTSSRVVVDEFCPRVKIDETVKEIGPLDVHIVELVQDDGSVIKTSQDRNDTLNKMLSSVDEIVQEYTGEDLRQVVEAEIQRRYKMMVKSRLSKSSRAATKAKELAKTVSEINWEESIKSGTLDKMYVSQLDMYLQKCAGCSKVELQEKGYTKAKKVEAVKRHFYTTKTKTSSSLPTNATNTNSNTVVIPWGGQTEIQDRTITLKNTCPIDNFLMIFHLLFNESSRIKTYFENCNDLVAQTLCRSLKLVGDDEFCEAKLEWLTLNPAVQPTSASVIDVWGNEENLFTQHLIPFMKSNVSTTCSSPFCPLPGGTVRWANTVALR